MQLPPRRSPTVEEQSEPLWIAIWETIKTWEINSGDGPRASNGSDVCQILDAIDKIINVSSADGEERTEADDGPKPN
jgi:hypothetical protein